MMTQQSWEHREDRGVIGHNGNDHLVLSSRIEKTLNIASTSTNRGTAERTERTSTKRMLCLNRWRRHSVPDALASAVVITTILTVKQVKKGGGSLWGDLRSPGNSTGLPHCRHHGRSHIYPQHLLGDNNALQPQGVPEIRISHE